jgi:hypothetical protein
VNIIDVPHRDLVDLVSELLDAQMGVTQEHPRVPMSADRLQIEQSELAGLSESADRFVPQVMKVQIAHSGLCASKDEVLLHRVQADIKDFLGHPRQGREDSDRTR